MIFHVIFPIKGMNLSIPINGILNREKDGTTTAVRYLNPMQNEVHHELESTHGVRLDIDLRVLLTI